MKTASLDQARKKKLKKQFAENYQLFILLALPLTWLIIFKYGPMYGLLMAFKDYDPWVGLAASEWVGFKYFEKFFSHYMFEKVIVNTLRLSIYYLLASFPFPILLALLINSTRRKRFGKAVQIITYMPYFISTVVLVGIILQITNSKIGVIASIVTFFGGTPIDIMASSDWFPHIYVWSGVWQNCGWGTIVYLAALSGVDKSLHEAAMIDGANRLQRVRFIDFPCILPTASIMLILNAGQIMNVGFEKVFLLQNNLNLDTSQIISTFVYTIGLSSTVPDISFATAIGLFNSVINFCLIIFVNAISKKLSNTSLF